MHKCLIFLMAYFFLATPSWSQANWSPYFMNRERFVHLSPDNQEKVLVKTMEMMVELESKYQLQVKTSGYSEQKFQQFVKLLNKLQSLLIESAVAAGTDPKTIPQLARLFSTLSENESLKGELCIYGGYISRTVFIDAKKGPDSRKVCTHPGTLGKGGYTAAQKNENYKDLDKFIIDAYAKGGSDCQGPSNISCNPAIFGFGDIVSKKPYCVPTHGPDKLEKNEIAHNVSYECMRKALDPKNKKNIDHLVETMKSDESAVTNMQTYVFKTCACTTDNLLDAKYKAYIKPHRTCYGMMNTLRIVNTGDCRDLDTVKFPTDQQEQWLKYFGKGEQKFDTLIAARNSDWDKAYTSLIDLKEVKPLCEGIAKEDETGGHTCSPGTCKEIEKDGVKKIVCEITEVTLRNKQVLKLKTTTYTPEKDKDVVTVEGGYDCKVTLPTEAKGCSIKVEDDNDKARVTVTFTGFKEKPEVEFNEGALSAEAPYFVIVERKKDKRNAEIKFKDKTPGCSGEISALSDSGEESYTLTVESDVQPQKVKLTAAFMLNGKSVPDPTSYKISWSRLGEGVARLKPVTAKAPAPKADNTKMIKDDPAPEAPASVPISGEIGTGNTITETRVDQPYDTCADLYKMSGGKSLARACKTIPPLLPAVPTSTGPAGGPMASPMAPPMANPSHNNLFMGTL